MAFTPKQYDCGKVKSLPVKAAEVITRHNHVKMSGGYLVAGAAGDNEVEYIALETVTGGSNDADVYCDVVPVEGDMVFHALTATTPVQATHVGNDYDFSDAATLDLTATTDKVFHIDKIVDATDKIVEGRFNKPALA